MDTDRRRLLGLAVGGVAVWMLKRASAAENAGGAPGDVVHLTLNVEGMH